MESVLCTKTFHCGPNFFSPLPSVNRLRSKTVLIKTLSPLSLHSRNSGRRTHDVGAAAKPLIPLNGNVPPKSPPEMDVQDEKNKPHENMASMLVEVWKSVMKWFGNFLLLAILQILVNFRKQVQIMLEKLSRLSISRLISTIGIGFLIWFQRDKMIGFLYLVVEYLNRYEPGIKFIVLIAEKAGLWKSLEGWLKVKLEPQLPPPNSHSLTDFEKQVEDVKTVVDKSQAENEVEVVVEAKVHVKIKIIDGKNRLIEKKFTATIVDEQEEANASESDNAE